MVKPGIIPPDPDSLERVERLRVLPKGSLVHVSGICGTGVSAVAALLKELGYRIHGSDRAFYPPMGDWARSIAEAIFVGYDPSHIQPDVDFVIIGNNLGATNPEVTATNERKIPFASMPEAFAALLIRTRDEVKHSIVVSGTHGKTTTTASIATMLDRCGWGPGYFVGGLPQDLPGNIRPVDMKQPLDRRCVVLEGDEYDSAFFAKWSKFHSYRPDIAVITSLEFDHADIFEDIHEIEREFDLFVAKVPDTGVVLVADTFPTLVQRAMSWRGSIAAPVVFYGTSEISEFRLLSRSTVRTPDGVQQQIRVSLRGRECELLSPLTGEHNAANLLVTAAVGSWLGISADEICSAIPQFRGVLRRQQSIFDDKGVTILEDFAHHPTAIRVTLRGIREAYPDRRIVCVYEPRSNTGRRHFFQEQYPISFAAADSVIIQKVADASGYSATGAPIQALDVQRVIADLTANGRDGREIETADGISDYLANSTRKGDVICVMSNGDFGGLHQKLVEGFRSDSWQPK